MDDQNESNSSQNPQATMQSLKNRQAKNIVSTGGSMLSNEDSVNPLTSFGPRGGLRPRTQTELAEFVKNSG